MEAKRVTMWVYANNDQEVNALQHELDKFVMDKYNQGILVKATTLQSVLQQYGNKPIVNAFLKQ